MKLPDFNTEDEEIKFWKKHSISNYWEDLKETEDALNIQSSQNSEKIIRVFSYLDRSLISYYISGTSVLPIPLKEQK